MGDARVPQGSPVHTVAVSEFAIDQFETTKLIWDGVRAWGLTNGYHDLTAATSYGMGQQPVQDVNWYDAIKWCNARSEREGVAPAYYTDEALTQVYRFGETIPFVNWNAGFRLPTEAEWEKAARGGFDGVLYPWGTDSITPTDANYKESGYSGTRPVGSYRPNPFGLYDTAGNIWEWCWDVFNEYGSDSQEDPKSASGKNLSFGRVQRGGRWDLDKTFSSVSYRYLDDPKTRHQGIYGFRSVLP